MHTASRTSEQSPATHPGARRDVASRATGERATMGPARHARPRVTLFSVPFKSLMTDEDVARLRASLDLATYITPKPGVSGASPGVVPLDFWSGLFLARSTGQDEWVLEGRTWGNPPESAVHEWHLRAALAARELDPGVPIPLRSAAPAADIPSPRVGHVGNKRRRRRLLGLE